VRGVVGGAGRGRAVSQGALVALAPDGAIRAMVGGLDHDKSAYNRVTQARRQPGSSFKAFVFGAALERGITPNDVREDAPVALGNWAPANYGGRYSGPVTLQQALARSINTISVRLTLEIGPDSVAAFARRCGITTIPEHPGPSIALGAYEVTLLQLAGAYQVFQTGGGKTEPYLIESVATSTGQSLFQKVPSAPLPVYDPLYATRMVGMLKTVITGGTGTGANIGRPAAGKTGTSQNWRDAWFVGFTPDLLAGVWVGNDNNRPMGHVTGGELPAEIWRRFMLVAEQNVTPTDFPWLAAEPQTTPETLPTAEGGEVYEDQPAIEGGAEVQAGGGGGRDDQGQPYRYQGPSEDNAPYVDAPPQRRYSDDQPSEDEGQRPYDRDVGPPPRADSPEPDEGDDAPPPADEGRRYRY
jgi:penicillin-binding protein 1A